MELRQERLVIDKHLTWQPHIRFSLKLKANNFSYRSLIYAINHVVDNIDYYTNKLLSFLKYRYKL